MATHKIFLPLLLLPLFLLLLQDGAEVHPSEEETGGQTEVSAGGRTDYEGNTSQFDERTLALIINTSFITVVITMSHYALARFAISYSESTNPDDIRWQIFHLLLNIVMLTCYAYVAFVVNAVAAVVWISVFCVCNMLNIILLVIAIVRSHKMKNRLPDLVMLEKVPLVNNDVDWPGPRHGCSVSGGHFLPFLVGFPQLLHRVPAGNADASTSKPQ